MKDYWQKKKRELLKKLIDRVESKEERDELIKFFFKSSISDNRMQFIQFYTDKYGLTTQSRKQIYSFRRMALMRFIEDHFGYLSRKKAAQIFHYASHTTIVHALKRSKDLQDINDSLFMEYYEEIKKEYDDYNQVQESKS